MGIYSSPYRYWVYDLHIARNTEPLGLAGDALIVFRNPVPVELRLDDIRNDDIQIPACEPDNPVHITGIPFKEIWMTNEAASGSIQIIVLFGGTNTEIIDAINNLQPQKGSLSGFLGRLGL